MRGVILDIDLKTDSGVICSTEGKRYSFLMQECLNEKPLAGCEVDFEPKEDYAKNIYLTKKSFKACADGLFWFLFSFRGRISRDQFFIFLTGLFFLVPLFGLMVTFAAFSTSFLITGFFFILYIKSCVIVKRSHDTGCSGWWLATTLILTTLLAFHMTSVLILPFLNGYISYVFLTLYVLLALFCTFLCFARGNIGKNAYGEEPYSCKTHRLK